MTRRPCPTATTGFILVCADGYSSSLAAATMRDLGFNRATDLDGEFNGWLAAGLPVEQLTRHRGAV